MLQAATRCMVKTHPANSRPSTAAVELAAGVDSEEGSEGRPSTGAMELAAAVHSEEGRPNVPGVASQGEGLAQAGAAGGQAACRLQGANQGKPDLMTMMIETHMEHMPQIIMQF